jgi:hypothetical protein
LKIVVFVLKGWKFLFLFSKFEFFCSCSCKLKILVLICWKNSYLCRLKILVFEGWKFLFLKVEIFFKSKMVVLFEKYNLE